MESQNNFCGNYSTKLEPLQPGLFSGCPVGPGEYSEVSSVPNGPFYSFTKASRFSPDDFETPDKGKNLALQNKRSQSGSFIQSLDLSPGPGSYDHSSTLYDKNITFKGKHRDLPLSTTPGPGSYFLPASSSKGFPEFKDRRMKNEDSVTANVQFLYNEYRSTSPSYSIGQRFKTNSPPDTPGPGSYDSKSSLISKPFTLKLKHEAVQGLNTPGPGCYSLGVTGKSLGPSIGLPLAPLSKTEVPGPGEYSPESRQSGPKYSIGLKFNKKQEEDSRDIGVLSSSFKGNAAILFGKPKDQPASIVPGPGAYSPERPKPNSGLALVKSQRELPEKPGPGPGDYSPSLKSESPCYSIRQLPKPPKENTFPGPGHYESSPSRPTGPVLRGKPKEPPPSLFPGPGYYNGTKSYSVQSFSQSRSNRFAEILDSPGPGDYSPLLKESSSKYRFSSEKRFSLNSSPSPGPGAYSPDLSSSQILISIRGKPTDITALSVPGPGSYSVDYKSAGPSFAHSNSLRTDFTKPFKKNPGPGSYETSALKTAGFSFAKDRKESRSLDLTPGPGAYSWRNIDRSIGTSLRGKPAEEPDAKVPGPGHYSTDLKSSVVSYKFIKRYDTDYNNKVPGPGSYLIPDRSDSPSWTMPKSKNPGISKENPGPGSYNPKTLSSTQIYSFGLKIDQKISESPGPGDYSPLLSKTNGFSFGQKSKERLSETPGPGSYEPRLSTSNPSWTISKKHESQKQSESPGPGHYDFSRTLSSSGVSFSKLERKFSPSKTPAPTDYNSDVSCLKDSIRYSVGKSSRTDFTKLRTKTPGPGSYSKELKGKVTLGKFSQASKGSRFDSDSKAPFVKVEVKPSGPFYSISGKRKDRKKELTPGPGAYQSDLKFKPNGPAYTMGMKKSLMNKLKNIRTFYTARGRK